MPAELSTRVKVFATAGVMLALLMAALDQTIVGTALPRIVAELNGLDRYSWLITGYLVASTVVVPIAGKMGDLFGRKPFLIAGMAGFVGASPLCGLAQDMNQLIVFRIIQGLFGGMLFASAFTTLADIFPPAQRARMQGLFGGVFGLASIVGPVVGGFLTDNWGWRWVFYVNLPVGLLGVLTVVGFLPALGVFGMIIFVPLETQGVLGVSVTNSGLLLTPMMLGLIVASVVTGQLMVRLKHYHYLGTIGAALMMVGIYIVAQTTPSTSQATLTAAIIIVGAGLGITFPLYINAVQSALPMRYLGVGTSQIQFWRNIGGTVSSAVLGSLLAQRLPGAIQDQVARLHLPASFRLPTSASSNNPNALLDPAKIAQAKAQLPAQAVPLFDQVMHAIREALAVTLHDIFLVAIVLIALALLASLLMPDVPLRARMRQQQPAFGETPASPEAAQPDVAVG